MRSTSGLDPPLVPDAGGIGTNGIGANGDPPPRQRRRSASHVRIELLDQPGIGVALEEGADHGAPVGGEIAAAFLCRPRKRSDAFGLASQRRDAQHHAVSVPVRVDPVAIGRPADRPQIGAEESCLAAGPRQHPQAAAILGTIPVGRNPIPVRCESDADQPPRGFVAQQILFAAGVEVPDAVVPRAGDRPGQPAIGQPRQVLIADRGARDLLRRLSVSVAVPDARSSAAIRDERQTLTVR
jgi:hypothetical protein